MNWLDMVAARRSVRQFLSSVNETDLALVQESCARAKGILGSDIRLILVPGSQVIPLSKGFVGGLGKIVAPWYIAAICRRDTESLFNLGYAAERVVLELPESGLGSCWLGGMYNREKARELVPLKADEAVQAFIAWGFPARETWSAVIKKAAGLNKRKELSELVLNDGELSEAWKAVAESVRWAPSAANRQPWRLFFDQGAIHLFSSGKGIIGHRLLLPIDMGIALCHLELACVQLGIKGQIIRQELSRSDCDYWATFALN